MAIFTSLIFETLDDLEKALIWVKEHQRKNGTTVKGHHRNVQTKAERKELIEHIAQRMAGGEHVAHANHASAIGAARNINKTTGKAVHAYQHDDGTWRTSHELPEQHIGQEGRVVVAHRRAFHVQNGKHVEFRGVRGPVVLHDPSKVKPFEEKIKRPKPRKEKQAPPLEGEVNGKTGPVTRDNAAVGDLVTWVEPNPETNYVPVMKIVRVLPGSFQAEDVNGVNPGSRSFYNFGDLKHMGKTAPMDEVSDKQPGAKTNDESAKKEEGVGREPGAKIEDDVKEKFSPAVAWNISTGDVIFTRDKSGKESVYGIASITADAVELQDVNSGARKKVKKSDLWKYKHMGEKYQPIESSGKKPGAQPGNDNAYKGGPKEEESDKNGKKWIVETVKNDKAGSLSKTSDDRIDAQPGDVVYYRWGSKDDSAWVVVSDKAGKDWTTGQATFKARHINLKTGEVGNKIESLKLKFNNYEHAGVSVINPEESLKKPTKSGRKPGAQPGNDNAYKGGSEDEEGTGRKPGGQPGNDNAYKGGPEEEEQAPDESGQGENPPVEARTFEGMTLYEVKQHIDNIVMHMLQNTHVNPMTGRMDDDGIGLNMIDHRVAERWFGRQNTDADYLFMASLIYKYKKQIIARFGDGSFQIIKDFIGAAKGADPETGEKRKKIEGFKEAQWLVDGKMQADRPQIQVFMTPDGAYGMQFQYNPAIVDWIKREIPPGKKRWNPENKQWIIHPDQVQKALDYFGDRAGIEISAFSALSAKIEQIEKEDAEKKEAEARAISEARTLAQGEMPGDDEFVTRALKVLKVPPPVAIQAIPGVDPRDGYVAVRFKEFNKDMNQLLKTAAFGASWNPTLKHWQVPSKYMPRVLAAFPDMGMDLPVYEAFGHLFNISDEELKSNADRLRFKEQNKEDTNFQEPEGWATHKMHDYQRKGANWLLNTKKGILGFGVGLGKTNISIAAAGKVLQEKKGPVICAVPGKRLYGWKKDIETALPGKRVLVLDQNKKERDRLIASGELNNYDFVIVTYRMQTIEKDALIAAKPAAVIYDEAHKLKGKQTQQTKAAQELSEASDYVWDLTATPMPNNPEELRTIIRRNYPTAMKTNDVFDKYYQWEWRSTPRGPVKKITGIKDPEGLAKEVSPFLFMKRGDAADVNLELPVMREGRTVLDDWEPHQASAYAQAAEDILNYIESLGQDPSAAEKAKVLVMMTKLEQIAIHPGMVDPNYQPAEGWRRPPKIQELLDEIENREGEFPGKGHVVFCRYTKALKLVQQEMVADGLFHEHEIATIDGETSKPDVARIEADLNEGRIKCVLCSDAAMEGLNFQKGSNHLVNLDTPWSPYMSEQRHGRVYRQGQKDPVRITTIALGDMDKKKLELSANKAKMNQDLFGGGNGEINAGALSVDDLKSMLGVKKNG